MPMPYHQAICPCPLTTHTGVAPEELEKCKRTNNAAKTLVCTGYDIMHYMQASIRQGDDDPYAHDCATLEKRNIPSHSHSNPMCVTRPVALPRVVHLQ